MQDIILYFYDFQVDPVGTAFGLGIPLTKDGVTTNIGEGSFPAFANGKSLGHWRIANELQGGSAYMSREDRLRIHICGRLLVAVSHYGSAEVKSCFLSSDPNLTAKSVRLSICAKEHRLKYTAGVQFAYLTGYLSELHFPGCIANSLKEEFSNIEDQSLKIGDHLPLIFEPTSVQGVFVIHQIVDQCLTGNFHFYGSVVPAIGNNASIRFSGDLMGSQLKVSSQLGQITEVVDS